MFCFLRLPGVITPGCIIYPLEGNWNFENRKTVSILITPYLAQQNGEFLDDPQLLAPKSCLNPKKPIFVLP